MQLYIFPPSQNSLRVQAVANQIGIDLELIPLNLTKREQMNEDFIKTNPNHKIPTLVDGDFVLWESTAIMLYLAEKFPDSGLIPSDLRQRVQMHQWMAWHLTQFSVPCRIYQFERLVKKIMNMGDPDPIQIAKADEDFHRYASVLNDRLSGQDWLIGETITLADHTVGFHLVHAERSGFPLEGYPEIRRWWKMLVNMEAWQKALPDMEEIKREIVTRK